MHSGRRILSALMSLALVLSLLGTSLAFAATEGETESNPPTFEGLADDSVSSVGDSVNLDEGSDYGIWVDPADVIEYVYVDEKIVALGQEQNIVFGLFDEQAVITQAEISFINSDTDERLSYPATVMVDNAALFTLVFTEDDDTALYCLIEISYCIVDSDETYRADFSSLSEEQDGGSYCFDVVTPQVFEVMGATPTEDGEVTAFVITDEGEFIAADSIEDALAIAVNDLPSSEQSGDSAATIVPLSEAIESASSSLQPFAVSSAQADYLIVALDPGHGAGDPGTQHNGVDEKDLNWKIALSCYNELLKYTGVSPMFTRAENVNPGLQNRVDWAVACGADVFVSLHNNSGSLPNTGTGSEVWIPNNASYLNSTTHVIGEQLGNKILAQLSSLGLYNRGVKTRNSETNERYPDGNLADYHAVIRASRLAGIPGIIIEHAFVDNDSDVALLKDDAFLASLGIADATGIANQYNLITHTSAQSSALLKYRSHIGHLGWETYVYDQKVSGTVGKGKAIEAFTIELQNQPTTGSIRYNANLIGSGWQGWKSSGQEAGTTGIQATVQALQIELSGNMAAQYDIYYRVHCQGFGWLDWAKNGALAGSINYNYRAEALQIAIVPKNTAAPGPTDTPFRQGGSVATSVTYDAHVATVGWQNAVKDGATAGTTGRSLAIEALKIDLTNREFGGNIEYNAHCAYLGWQGWKSNSAVAGTTGQSRQIEALQIRLTGDMAIYYDVYYRAHCQNFGWLGWAKNGACAGSGGYGFRMEALQIRLVAKGGAAPGSTNNAYIQPSYIQYQTHVAEIGWQGLVRDGATAGTTGRSLRIEALAVALVNPPHSGGIEYNAHCANIGWQGWKNNGQIAGTTGQSRQVEAVQIRLSGDMATFYDVYYRAHCQEFGWLGWAKNGESAGTAGYAYRMEALQIALVAKGGAAPGNTGGAFSEKSPTAGTPIMGGTNTTVDQMVRRYNATGRAYPSSVYSSKGAPTIRDFCQIVYEEATAEGVRPEVMFCQAMYETGWLGFGGLVKAEQCNFGGLGATGAGVGGATFSNVREGVRAHVQHLKAYAVPGLKESDLRYPCVDPRFNLVSKGSAPTLEALNGKWAVPGDGYGERIRDMINDLYRA